MNLKEEMFRRQILVRLYHVYFIGVSDSKKFLTIHEVNEGITSMSQLESGSGSTNISSEAAH